MHRRSLGRLASPVENYPLTALLKAARNSCQPDLTQRPARPRKPFPPSAFDQYQP